LLTPTITSNEKQKKKASVLTPTIISNEKGKNRIRISIKLAFVGAPAHTTHQFWKRQKTSYQFCFTQSIAKKWTDYFC